MSRGVLLVGHGSHHSPSSSTPVYNHARRLRERGKFDEVRTGFWREEPSLARALDGCEAADVTVVPVMVSAGYFTSEVIPREMRLTGRVSRVDGKCVRYAAPFGAHPSLAKVIVQRALEAGAEGTEALAVLGHGTPRNPDSERNVYEQTRYVAALGRFPEVTTVFLEQEPNMKDVFALVQAERVVMVPLFVADGWHVGETIPEELALDGDELRQGGRRLRYARAVGTHPAVAGVIEEMVAEAQTW
jgi:sirohydrochlorin cobaltochelatase